MKMIKYILLVGLARISLGLNNEDICNAQQVNAAFCVDGTTNVRPEQLKHIGQLIERIADTFAEGSDGTCAFINDENTELLEFKLPTESDSLKENLKKVIEHATPVGNKVYPRALENEVTKRSTVSRYKERAEIFYLIVSDTTDIEKVPEILTKKKLFVIVLGKKIPKRLEDLASSIKHVHLVNKLEDVESVADLVAQQTCIDSHFKCDVDQYMEKRSIKCKSCMSVCSSLTVNQSSSCLYNCPYIHLPLKKAAEKSELILDHNGVNNSTLDPAKKTVLIFVTCILSVIVVVVISLVVYKNIRRKSSGMFGTHREIPSQTKVHVSDPLQEIWTLDNQIASNATGTRQPLLEDANNDSENAGGYSLYF